MSDATSALALPTLGEVREVLAALLPLTGWLPPSGPFRVLDRLSPAHGNPDETRAMRGDDGGRAYLGRQVARSDWQRWRGDTLDRTGLFARQDWPWTVGPALDAALVLRDYPVDGKAAVVLVELPLVAVDRSEVLLRAQTHGPSGDVDDHELCFRRLENGSWMLSA